MGGEGTVRYGTGQDRIGKYWPAQRGGGRSGDGREKLFPTVGYVSEYKYFIAGTSKVKSL